MADELTQIPTNYHYQGMSWVFLILFIVLFLTILTFYFIGRKKEWAYKKRGLIIGLILGLIWLIISVTGTSTCHWNPVEGSVVPDGICKILYCFMYSIFQAYLLYFHQSLFL